MSIENCQHNRTTGKTKQQQTLGLALLGLDEYILSFCLSRPEIGWLKSLFYGHKEQIISGYLTQGGGFRKLAAKYGISRTTICKWVAIYKGINIPPSRINNHRFPSCVSVQESLPV